MAADQRFSYCKTDFWGRRVYRDTLKSRLVVAVEGILHTMTEEGEPSYPINIAEPK